MSTLVSVQFQLLFDDTAEIVSSHLGISGGNSRNLDHLLGYPRKNSQGFRLLWKAPSINSSYIFFFSLKQKLDVLPEEQMPIRVLC